MCVGGEDEESGEFQEPPDLFSEENELFPSKVVKGLLAGQVVVGQ